MTDRAARIKEIERLERIQRIRELEAQQSESQESDAYYTAAKDELEGIGGDVMGVVNKTTAAVDRVNPLGAALRSGIGAAQKGQPVGEAYANQYLRDPSTAPSGKDLMRGFGVSEEEFDTPLIANPFTNEKVRVSPAGVLGGLFEGVTDPLNYGGAVGAKVLGSRGVRGAIANTSRKVGKGLQRTAELRAVKAATGENIGAIRKMAKVKRQNAGDVDAAIANLRKTGRRILGSDEAGPPVVGWFDTAEDIGRNAEAKREFFGGQIENVGPTVDRLAPDAITPQGLSEEVAQYSRGIPNVGKGAPARKYVAEEAERLRHFPLAEEEMGPPAPLRFAQAQQLKGQYPWEPTSQSPLITDRDATSRINRIISSKMDDAAIKAQANPNASPEDIAVLQRYKPAKQNYHVYKNVSDAGTEQAMRTLGRRVLSPSSNAAGMSTFVATAKDGYDKAGLYGAGAALVNQQILQRGSAFGARAADAISKRVMRAPQAYRKWLPAMQGAATAGPAAVVQLHHQLMNQDPQYRQLMFEGGSEEGP